MTFLNSKLLPPGLLLCLGLVLSSTTSQSTYGRCPFFTNSNTINGPPISAHPKVYSSNKLYNVMVPVDGNVSFVILRALDKMNNQVGIWQGTSQPVQECPGSGKYNRETFNGTLLMATWRSPNSLNLTAVQLECITVRAHSNATYASLMLTQSVSTTTTVSTTTPLSTTTTTPATTPATSISAANIPHNPIADAIEILLVFLVSKLIF